MLAVIVHGIGGAALLVLWVWAVLDCISTDSILVRNLPKGTWIFLVVFVPTIGSIAWLLLGRPEHAGLSLGGQRSWLYRDDYQPRTFASPAPRGLEDDPSWRPSTTRSAPGTLGEDGDESLAVRERKLLEREAELAKREAELREAELREAESAEREADDDAGDQNTD